MDSVELVLRTEDEFGITISDDEAAAAITVGDLYNLILSKLDVAPGCLTSRAFYLTRRALVESLQVPRGSIRPATPLSPLLSGGTRRQQWQNIREGIGLQTPPLRFPAAIKQDLYKRSFFLSSAIVFVLCVAGLSHGWPDLLVISMSAVLWIALTVAGCTVFERLSTSLATELPADTAGELARVVLSLNHEHFAAPEAAAKITNEDIWRRIVDIVCDQLQVDRAGVVPNARFVDDLGVS